MGPLRYIDAVLLVVAAPILLLIGVPALGYGVAAGVWLGLRVVDIGVKRYAAALGEPKRELIVKQLVFPLVRIFLLALTVILVRRGGGRDDGLTALLVIVVAFTIYMAITFVDRPRAG